LKLIRSKAFWASFVALAMIPVFFQNCAPVQMSGSDIPVVNKSMGNGGPYGGLFKSYRYYNSVQPCSTQDLKGRPLPNTEILFKPDAQGQTAPFLARETCTDLQVPTLISSSDLQITDSSFKTVTYKNFVMTSQSPAGEFDVAAAQCPVGKSAIAGAARTNHFLNSQDWMILRDPVGPQLRPGWYSFAGIGVNLFSTIQSLPAFMVQRNDPANLDLWARHDQYVQLKSSTDYVFSFVAQGGTVNGANTHIFRGMNSTPGPADETVLVRFDFQNRTTTIEYAVNISGVSATITPFGNGFLCTIYFRSSATANTFPTSIGVTPTTYGQSYGQMGDSIIATAAQLVEVNNFCQ
jgi:hypothetical protein